MPDFGIGEAATALGLGDVLGLGDIGASIGGLLGIGGTDAAAAGAVGAGAGLAGEAATGAAGAGGLADIVGSGGALFGGTTGLEGTALAGGVTGGIPDLVGSTGVGSLLGGAADFLGAPAASAFSGPSAGFGTTAVGGAGGASPVGGGGASVFDTGTSPVTGMSSNGAPAATGATGVSAPAGVTAPVDATSAATGAAPSGAASAASGAAKSTSIGDLLGKAGTGAMNSVTSNPLGIGLGAAGLGYNILQGQKQTANQQALAGDAATATANSTSLVNQGEALTQYLQNGTLPPAYMQQVDQALNDAKTKAISNAAAQGLPTDPTKNTSLAATLAGIDNQKAGMISQVAQTLFSSGAGLINAGGSAAGLSGNLYSALVSNDTTQSANMGKAIATLAAALNGKSNNSFGGTNIQVSQGN
jgi:hypothetical protein